VFTHILIPTDLTDRTEPTLALAVKMPRKSSTHFTLLHVVQTISAGSAAGVKPEVVFGKPAEEIVRFAAAHRADLIVLASHRIDVPGGQPDLGTVSYKVSSLAPGPILLVK
jgi:nucleotide-binding universal stress UspA family protein